ncbi:MAG TPA: class I SAM-dependent methyltransferase [candidate division Zixibacteria bacterium]|nr:class I SAM-dependent methyltransferase [candidate division Zixibacteria bacterium]
MDELRKKYFEACADEWDKSFTAEDYEILSFLIDSFNISKKAKIADLGCGTGIMFDMLRRKVGSDGMIVGVDFSGRMVKKARQNFPFDNVYEVDGDVEDLPLQSGSFDMAISFAAFAHFTNQKKVMEEASRILKQGGKFHIIHLSGSKELVEFHQQVGGPVAQDHLPADADMMKLFEHGHFLDVKIQDHPGLYLASATKG